MMRHSRPICGRYAAPAFSLTEMLLVMAVLGALLTLVMPLFARAMEISRSVKCKSNLHNIASALHTDDSAGRDLPGGSVHTIPTASRWLDFMLVRRMHELVICPSGKPNKVGMKDLWIRQDGHATSTWPGISYSNISDLLEGLPVDDAQVSVLYPANGVEHLGQDNEGWDWVQELNGGNPPAENEAFVAITTCAAFLITIEGSFAVLTPLGAHPNPQWPSRSDHYLLKGEPNEETWEDDELVRLTGVGYSTVNPPVRVFAGHVHYGMSNLVHTRLFRHGQLWLVEYSTDMMRLSTNHRDEAFDDDMKDGEVMGRHFGSANYVRVDGSVSSMSKNGLEVEFENIDTGVENVFQN